MFVEELTVADPILNRRKFLLGIVSKFVPVIVTAVPGMPIVGVKFVMVGEPLSVVTVNTSALAADPDGVVTPIGPVLAPEGTVVTILVSFEEVTLAEIPLNVTVF